MRPQGSAPPASAAAPVDGAAGTADEAAGHRRVGGQVPSVLYKAMPFMPVLAPEQPVAGSAWTDLMPYYDDSSESESDSAPQGAPSRTRQGAPNPRAARVRDPLMAKPARSSSRPRVAHMFPNLVQADAPRHLADSERSLLAEPQPEVAAPVPELSSVASGTQLIAPW